MPTEDFATELIAQIRALADPTRAIAQGLLAEAPEGPVQMLSIGKASVPMAKALCDRHPVREGLVVAVDGQGWSDAPGSVRVLTTDHPLPTPRNVEAAKEVRDWLRSIPTDAKLMVLISGGGSSQLCLPVPGLTLDDVREVSDQLMRTGATIDELNTVRKHIDLAKGGRLAQAVGAADVRALVVSDVLGDRMDTVSSGPFFPDDTTIADASEVLDRASIEPTLRSRIQSVLSESPKPGELRDIPHRLVLNNAFLVEGVMRAIQSSGIAIAQARFSVQGEASKVGQQFAIDLLAAEGEPAAVVYGGETTVSGVSKGAKGGPCQEAAIAAALELGDTHATVITLATDGIDGPTDAAGAILRTPLTSAHRTRFEDAIRAHDSYHALDEAEALVRTGTTGTNVNDVLIAIRGTP